MRTLAFMNLFSIAFRTAASQLAIALQLSVMSTSFAQCVSPDSMLHSGVPCFTSMNRWALHDHTQGIRQTTTLHDIKYLGPTTGAIVPTKPGKLQ